ncbi:MAG: HAD family hydrolase [Candidatus Bathyarchaeia archaeon]
MIDAVLFDCWGTILQAPNLMRRGASTEIFYRSLTDSGCDVDFDSFRDAYVEEARRQRDEAKVDFRELDYVQRIDSTLHAVGFQHPQRRLLAQRVWADYLAEWPRQSTFFEDAMPLLSSLKRRYKLGLVTNFPDGPTAREVFNWFEFDEVFDCIVISGEVGYRKPNPIIFERALSYLRGSPESTVMVGDTLDADVLGPKKIGMKAILIDANRIQEENHHLADVVVRNLGEVREALKCI